MTDAPHSRAPGGSGTLPWHRADWNSVSGDEANRLAQGLLDNIGRQDAIWDDFDSLTSALKSSNRDRVLEQLKLRGDVPLTRIRDAWLSKHGADISDAGYRDIGGDEGYERYRQAFRGLSRAIEGSG